MEEKKLLWHINVYNRTKHELLLSDLRKRCQGAVWHQTKQEPDNIPKIRKCEEWCEIFVKVRGVGLNLEAAAAILKPSCSQATGP